MSGQRLYWALDDDLTEVDVAGEAWDAHAENDGATPGANTWRTPSDRQPVAAESNGFNATCGAQGQAADVITFEFEGTNANLPNHANAVWAPIGTVSLTLVGASTEFTGGSFDGGWRHVRFSRWQVSTANAIAEVNVQVGIITGPGRGPR